MYVTMDEKEINLDNLNEIYRRIREIFSNVKPHNELPKNELVQLYSSDKDFLNDMNYIGESLSEIAKILVSIDILEMNLPFFYP